MPTPPTMRELTNLVQEKLPRELRGMVYAFLWDDEEMETLNYGSHLDLSDECPYFPDNANNAICTCSGHPVEIPQFAQSGIVGYHFAYEAVLWLYEHPHIDYFSVTSFGDVKRFFEKDLFHIGLKPSISNCRCLTIEFEMDEHVHLTLMERLRSLVERNFEAFYGSHILPGSRLDIVITVRDDSLHSLYLHALAVVVTNLKPYILKIARWGKVDVTMIYNHEHYGQFNIKPMLDPSTDNPWTRFAEVDIPARMRQVVDGKAVHHVIAHHLRYWEFQWENDVRELQNVADAQRSRRRQSRLLSGLVY